MSSREVEKIHWSMAGARSVFSIFPEPFNIVCTAGGTRLPLLSPCYVRVSSRERVRKSTELRSPKLRVGIKETQNGGTKKDEKFRKIEKQKIHVRNK